MGCLHFHVCWQFREAFADSFVKGSASSPLCQVLLDLCRLPVPASPSWTVVRGSALAALCNAGLNQPRVREGLCVAT